jgi:GTP cyclohydrolase II
MIVRLAEGPLLTKFGTFTEVLYYDGKEQYIALVMGSVEGKSEVLCRVHSECISAHNFNSIECDCREQMELAQFLIGQAGTGIVVWMNQEGRGNGHLALLWSAKARYAGQSQSDAYVAMGFEEDARSYKRAAEILKDLGVESVVLLTNSPHKIGALKADGVNISGTKPLVIEPDNDILKRTFADKVRRGHLIPLEEEE